MLSSIFKNKAIYTSFKELGALSFKTNTYFAAASFSANKDLERLEKFDRYDRDNLKSHRWLPYDPEHKASQKTHKSKSEEYIAKVPVIYVDSDKVRCIGGTKIQSGHPQIYLNLDTRKPGSVVTCNWCGLRYAKKLE
mmetsp:Transcript_33181/g.30120  ORF Transcript_33181/g.30120 Transcript_33181/m.30120 type:complete len:137 (+) Transcript_33181:70-480(+)|eukprot:CAMPEP_0114585814 /NCGR_PEP_ID=MMETSP0125-20121206/9246_1 /TAXON_ID=485358 ORGANISM="Aristerostoma sp., Strain ATCC 50986" /NCGR_SAMPLE_ID=MMETSP0125 /ASSEMBLY_ACC=CAM_ASM_000245 /LENGTH=136 /DNA_ID=CAMNT_0001781045 /DNA_START=66 /DNA_END=476 /DNA_ORIENTATION=+